MRESNAKSRGPRPANAVRAKQPDQERAAGQSEPTTHVNGRGQSWNIRLAARLRKGASNRSFREIASRTGSNSETVRRYLRDGNPSVRFLARFCLEFRVSADWVLGNAPRIKAARPDGAAPTQPTRSRDREVEVKPALRSPTPKRGRRSVRAAGAPLPPVDEAPSAAASAVSAIIPQVETTLAQC